MVNGVSMDNVEHAFAVQQLRKSGKNAKIVSIFYLYFSKSINFIIEMFLVFEFLFPL